MAAGRCSVADAFLQPRPRVLVTGCTGQIGSALLACAPDDLDVRGVSHGEFDIGSASDIAAVLAEHRPALIVNAAAYTAVDLAETEREQAFRVNAYGPAGLADAARERGIRLVHLSSDFVFDGSVREPYRWNARTRPLSVYGASKAAGEAAVRSTTLAALIVRTSWVYAAHGRNFVHTMLRLLARPEPVRVVADQFGIPTHAGSFARALWPLIDSGATGIHHLTDAGATTWYDFAVAIGQEAHRLGLLPKPAAVTPIETRDYPTPARRPAFSVLDSDETWTGLGRRAPHWRSELRAVLSELGKLGERGGATA